MDILFHKFAGIVNGVFKGFDRTVFKGHSYPLRSRNANIFEDLEKEFHDQDMGQKSVGKLSFEYGLGRLTGDNRPVVEAVTTIHYKTQQIS